MRLGRNLLLIGSAMVIVTLAANILTWRWEVANQVRDGSLFGMLSAVLLFLVGPAGAVCVIAGIATLRNGRDHLKAGQEKEGF